MRFVLTIVVNIKIFVPNKVVGMKMRSTLQQVITVLLLSILSMSAYAQTDRLLVYGTVKDERSGKKLSDVQVILVEDGSTKKTFVTTLNGKFELDLDFDHDYDIRFTKDGYVTKFININTKNVPENNKVGGFGFELDMSLFEVVEGVNFDILKKPIGKANYVESSGEIGFDYEYTRSIQAEIARLRRALEKKYAEEEERLLREQQEAERLRKLQEQFDQLVAQGDQEFAATNFMNSVFKYSDALDLIPGNAVVEQKLAKAKAALEDQQKKAELEEKYAQLIKDADNLVAGKQLVEAKAKYESALSLKPKEAYPQQQINTINAELERAKKAEALEKQYADLVAKGDASFNAKDYTASITSYEAALKLKPNEGYPAKQINAANEAIKNLKAQEELERQYADLIKTADGSFNNKSFADAIGLYTEALKIKPNEQYPKDQIAKAKGAIEAEKAEQQKNERYDNFVKAGDKAFASKQYEDAISNFQSASELKPAEQYPKDQIAAAKKAIEEKKNKEALDKQYNDLIVDADADMNAANYESAIGNYEAALKIKPSEAYPKEQIAAAKETLAKLAAEKEAEQQYKNAIAAADKSFAAEDYKAAITNYTKASGIKPNEPYPQDQIAKANKILAEREAANKEYANQIAAADKEFNQANYEQAIPAYQKALAMRPDEQYPKDQIAAAKVELEKINAEKAKDQAYKDAIAIADASFAKKEWTASISGYEAALAIKAGEQYPTDKIAEARANIEKEKEQQALLEQYNKIIIEADKKLDAKSYKEAITQYQSALQIRPSEQYPKDQIAKAQAALDNKAKEEELNKQYQDLVAKGDQQLGEKSYQAAITSYQSALQLKPEEQYPKDQIAKAKKALEAAAKEAEINEQYKTLIASADGAFNGKKYNEAITIYQEASGLKPNEQYPIDQIAKAQAAIDKQAKEKEKEMAYNGIITEADQLFAGEKYTESIAKYQEAIALKPDASYPKDQIQKAQDILDKKERDAARNQQFNDLVMAGDAKFDGGEYEAAVAKYKEALDIKPKEQYPKDQIAKAQKEIQAKLAAKELEQNYASLLQRADAQFDSTKFDDAIASYQEALQLKPGEKYPKDQIAAAKIRKEEQERKAKQREQYMAFIEQGDKAFSSKKYAQSITHYQDALTLVPGEKYPKDQIALAQEELDKLNKAYQESIALGDQNFKAKKWQEAIDAYTKASGLKPSEQYPKDQIERATEEMNKPTVVAFTDITKFGEVNKDSVKATIEKPVAQEKPVVNAKPKVMYKTTNEGNTDDFRKLLGDNYPEGITKEKYVESNKEIFRTIYVVEGYGDELLRIVARFGTFYFKNGSSISSYEYSNFLESIGANAN